MNKENKTTDTTPRVLGQTLTSYAPGHSQSVPSLAEFEPMLLRGI